MATALRRWISATRRLAFPAVDKRLLRKLAQTQFDFIASFAPVVILLVLGWMLSAWIDARTPPPNAAWDLTQPFVGVHRVNALHVPVIYHGDSTGQRAAHKVMLVGLAIMVLATMIAVARGVRTLTTIRWLEFFVALAGLGTFLYFWLRVPVSMTLVGWISGLLVVAIPLARWLRNRSLNSIVGTAILLIMLAFHFPALAQQVDLSRQHWDAIELYEMHFAIVTTQGERLLAGERMFEEVFPYYGLNMSLVSAGLNRLFGTLTINDSVRWMNLLQLAYVAMLLFGYRYVSRGRWIAVLFPALFAVCLYGYGHHLQMFPNFLAYRYLGLALAPACLIVLRNSNPWFSTFAIGSLNVFCLLHNPETGIAVTVGLVGFMFFRHFASSGCNPVRWLASLAVFAAGAATGILVFVCLFRFIIGYWPDASWPGRYVETLSFIAASGYSGMTYNFEPMAVVIFAHCLWVILAVARKPQGTQGFSDSLRVAVAAMTLVWFAYYTNRPQQEGLFANALLYGYLLADAGRVLLAAWRRPRLFVPALLSAAVIALVFVPYIANLMQRETGRYLAALQKWSATPDESVARSASGIWVRLDERGSKLFDKAEYLASIKHEGPIAYATVDPYLIPKISGVWSDLPFVDVFWESITRHQYEYLMRAMLDPKRDRILIDSEASVAACDPPAGMTISSEFRVPKIVEVSRAYYRRLRDDIAKEYTLVGVVHGWEDWRRKQR